MRNGRWTVRAINTGYVVGWLEHYVQPYEDGSGPVVLRLCKIPPVHLSLSDDLPRHAPCDEIFAGLDWATMTIWVERAGDLMRVPGFKHA